MERLNIIMVILIAGTLLALLFQNTHPVSMRFLWFRADAPMIFFFLLIFISGFILGLLLSLKILRRGKSEKKR